jgi:hypothetical protein
MTASSGKQMRLFSATGYLLAMTIQRFISLFPTSEYRSTANTKSVANIESVAKLIV